VNKGLGRLWKNPDFIKLWSGQTISQFGFLLGGFLGERTGLWPTLLVAGVGLIFSNLWLSFSPLPHIKEPNLVPKDLAITESL